VQSEVTAEGIEFALVHLLLFIQLLEGKAFSDVLPGIKLVDLIESLLLLLLW